MTFNIPAADYNRQPKDVLLFLETWKRVNGYQNPTLDVQQCIELLKALSKEAEAYDFGQKDRVLELDSLVIAHDGDDLIEVAFFEVVQAVKKKLFLKKLEAKKID